MKKKSIIIIVIVIIILLIAIPSLRIFFNGGEDTWIKDSREVYIKHGNPSATPDYVKEQQNLILQASNLYNQKKAEEMQFNSQCLGLIGDYAVDIVHVPRTTEDNLAENQCSDYREGKVSHFIELDKDGNIVRIV